MEMDQLNYSMKEMENKRKNFRVYEEEEEEGVEGGCGVGMNKKKNAGGGSGRWQPTKEQIEILEGVYAGGVKTPSAEQIQQITARLSAYGRIQGKNVFYWFQNTKARRRHHHHHQSKAKHTHDHDHDHDRRLLYHPPMPIHPGFYFLPYAQQDQVVPSRMWGPLQQPAECKATLELFPLHPGGGVATTCNPPPPAPAPAPAAYHHHHHHHHTSCQQQQQHQQHQHQQDHSALLQPAGGPRAGFIDFFSANPHS